MGVAVKVVALRVVARVDQVLVEKAKGTVAVGLALPLIHQEEAGVIILQAVGRNK